MIDRCDNCDRNGCREARAVTWAQFYACSCKPNLSNPCEHQRAFQDADSECQAHAVNWRERAMKAESDLTALRERMRWVPVGEEVYPEPGLVVLVTDGRTVYAAYLSTMTEEWEGECLHNPDAITHWQPMPAAPEVQNG